VSATEYLEAAGVEPRDEPPVVELADSVVYWRRRHAAAADTVTHLHRVVDDAVAVLRENGLHVEADHIDRQANPW